MARALCSEPYPCEGLQIQCSTQPGHAHQRTCSVQGKLRDVGSVDLQNTLTTTTSATTATMDEVAHVQRIRQGACDLGVQIRKRVHHGSQSLSRTPWTTRELTWSSSTSTKSRVVG